MFDELPKGFQPAKPSDIGETGAENLIFHNACIVQRKRDGQRILAMTTGAGEVRLYSRGCNDMTKHLPGLVYSVKQMNLPPHSMLDGEFVVNGAFEADVFAQVGSVLRSLPERAAALEGQYATQYYVFDILYWAGTEMWRQPYRVRYDRLRSLEFRGNVTYAKPLEGTWSEIRDRVLREKWEGIVLWMLNEASSIRFDDHVDRCGSHRWKPVKTDDFVCHGFEMGKGKHSGRVGALKIAQYDPDKFGLFDYGTVGTGLTDRLREDALNWAYPCVIEVEYQSRGDNGMLRFPRFLRVRTDKTVKECVRWQPSLL